MRSFNELSYFDDKTVIPNQWLENYDVIILSNFSKKLEPALESQVKRIPILLSLVPELKQIDLKNKLLIFGKSISQKMAFKLNPAYKIEFIGSEKIDTLIYSQYIQKNTLPVSTIGYLYFHDFYFHVLGMKYIPLSFTSWWNKNKTSLDPVDQVMMASIVEWTTLKQLSPIIEDMFSPDKWNQLDLFFMDQNRVMFNAKALNKTYKKYLPEVKTFLEEWKKL